MNKKIFGGLNLLDAGPKGKGVFANRDFLKGSRLLEFRGPVLEADDVHDFTHVIQIGRDRFMGASGGLDDFVNHSCDPNSFLRSNLSRLELVARRDISRGEELTFDYSTCMVDEPELENCFCGSAKCRGQVQVFSRLPQAIRMSYRRAHQVPAFALERLGVRPKTVLVERR